MKFTAHFDRNGAICVLILFAVLSLLGFTGIKYLQIKKIENARYNSRMMSILELMADTLKLEIETAYPLFEFRNTRYSSGPITVQSLLQDTQFMNPMAEIPALDSNGNHIYILFCDNSFKLWASGPNGRNENGLGDDVLVERSFSVVVNEVDMNNGVGRPPAKNGAPVPKYGHDQ
jgi:hypothetical protein